MLFNSFHYCTLFYSVLLLPSQLFNNRFSPSTRTRSVLASNILTSLFLGTLILVRHGQTTMNYNKTFTGWIDTDLSDFGKREVSTFMLTSLLSNTSLIMLIFRKKSCNMMLIYCAIQSGYLGSGSSRANNKMTERCFEIFCYILTLLQDNC